MTDIAGNEVKVGDTIYYVCLGGHSAYLVEGVIEKIETLNWCVARGKESKRTTGKTSNEIIKKHGN